MASIHISEAEAARDFSALLDRALAGEDVVIQRGTKDVAVLRSTGNTRPKMRTLGEILDLLAEKKRTEGLTPMDPDFAADMEAIHEEMNRPMDTSKWD